MIAGDSLEIASDDYPELDGIYQEESSLSCGLPTFKHESNDIFITYDLTLGKYGVVEDISSVCDVGPAKIGIKLFRFIFQIWYCILFSDTAMCYSGIIMSSFIIVTIVTNICFLQ